MNDHQPSVAIQNPFSIKHGKIYLLPEIVEASHSKDGETIRVFGKYVFELC